MRQRRSSVGVVLALAVVAALTTAAAAQSTHAPQARPGGEILETISPQPGLVSPYPPLLEVAFLAAIVGAVWLTYGYVVYQVYCIWAERPPVREY